MHQDTMLSTAQHCKTTAYSKGKKQTRRAIYLKKNKIKIKKESHVAQALVLLRSWVYPQTSVLFFFFLPPPPKKGDWTRGFMHARQTLHHLSSSPHPAVYFMILLYDRVEKTNHSDRKQTSCSTSLGCSVKREGLSADNIHVFIMVPVIEHIFKP